MGVCMELWKGLFSDLVGIMSALVMGFLPVMAIWFAWYFISHIMKETQNTNTFARASNDDKNGGSDIPS